MRKGPQESPADVSHGVDTDGRALEDGAGGRETGRREGRARLGHAWRESSFTWRWRRPRRPRGCACPLSAAGRRPLWAGRRDSISVATLAQRHLSAGHPGEHSRSSSKYVSAPSAPGTAQTSRAFRNVVHLFTRLLCPPTSFCGARGSRWVSGGARTPGTPAPAPACTHPADLADAGEAGLAQPLLPLHRRLPEEEVDFVVVGVLALRHPKNIHELGLWGQRGATSRACRHLAGTGSPGEP